MVITTFAPAAASALLAARVAPFAATASSAAALMSKAVTV